MAERSLSPAAEGTCRSGAPSDGLALSIVLHPVGSTRSGSMVLEQLRAEAFRGKRR